MIEVKKAELKDIKYICGFTHDLAEYEKMSEACIISETELEKLIFKERLLHAVIAYNNGVPVGFSSYLYMVSTFKGKKILYIEDIYVKTTERGAGAGKALINTLEEIAKENDCINMEWKCLKWNKTAQQFYDNSCGKCDDEWLTYFKKIF